MNRAAMLLAIALALPAQAAERWVALGGAVAETVFALGRGDALVAVDDSARSLPQAARLPSVGYYRMLNAEGVLALSPTRVLASEHAGPPGVLERIARAGVPVQRFATPADLDSLLAMIADIGQAIAVPEVRVRALAESLRRNVHHARTRLRGASPRVVVLLGADGRMLAAGRGTAAEVMLRMVGARPALDFPGYKPVSAETLLDAAPDAVLIAARSVPERDAARRVPLPGVPAERRHVVDAGFLLGLGPRSGQAALWLAEVLAPGAAR